MPDLSELPLEQLLLHCTPLLPSPSPQGEAAWCELQSRAFAGNDAAWDALVRLLWSNLLGWIYAQRPELSPAVAADIAQRVLIHFSALPLRLPPRLLPFATTQLALYLQAQITHFLRRSSRPA